MILAENLKKRRFNTVLPLEAAITSKPVIVNISGLDGRAGRRAETLVVPARQQITAGGEPYASMGVLIETLV